MKYCTKCGKELFDEAVACPDCGAKTDGEVITSEKKPHTSNNKKIPKLLLIIGCIVLVLGIVAAILFHRPNLRIDDFKLHKTPVGAIIQFGIPDRISDDGNLIWDDCGIEFYGIPVFALLWDAEDYSVYITVDSENDSELQSKVRKICDDYDYDFLGNIHGDYKNLHLYCTDYGTLLVDFK